MRATTRSVRMIYTPWAYCDPFCCAPSGCSPVTGINLMCRIGLIYELICSALRHRSRVPHGALATPDPGLTAAFRLPCMAGEA